MKLTESAKNTLNQLFANGIVSKFNTTAIFAAGRSNGMKFRVIKETFMTDAFKVGYGKYDLRSLLDDAQHSSPAVVPAAAPASAKKKAKTVAKKKMSESQLLEQMIHDSATWEQVYCSENEDVFEKAQRMFQ
jgi:hypothetical protein